MTVFKAASLAAYLTLASFSAASAVVMVEQGDPIMAEAFEKAKAGLDDFLTKAENPPEGTYNYTVKIGIFDEGDSYRINSFPEGSLSSEFFWLSDIEKNESGYTGRISNEPEMVEHIEMGQTIAFTKEDIADWFYMDEKGMTGNFTGCAIAKITPSAEIDELFRSMGLVCDTQAITH